MRNRSTSMQRFSDAVGVYAGCCRRTACCSHNHMLEGTLPPIHGHDQFIRQSEAMYNVDRLDFFFLFFVFFR